MIQRTLEMQFDKLIIGADLDALRFAYANKIPFIYSKKKEPLFYDLDGYCKTYNRHQEILAYASLRNLNPFSTLVQAIRVQDDNTLKVATTGNFSVIVNFNKLYISDDRDIEGLPPVTHKWNNKNLVIDHTDVNSGLYHDYDELTTDDDLVKKIFFRLSTRFKYKFTDINKDNKKDCIVISLIETENLDLLEYSQVATRLKTAKVMKAAGIKGRWDKTNERFKLIKLTSRKREIYPLWKNLYNDLPKNMEVIYNVPEVVIEEDNLYGEIQKLQIQ